MKRTIGGLLLVALLGLAGCGGGSGTADKEPSPAQSSGEIGIPPGETGGTPTYPAGRKPRQVTLSRTGGIAGVDQRIVLQPGGAWTYTDGDREQKGELTDQQVSKLQSLAMKDALPEEAKRQDTGDCADGFTYSLKAGDVTVTGTDCGDGFANRPVFKEMIDLLVDATPM